MKNKFIFFLTICLFININYYNIKAEEFIFESPVIEITNSGNIEATSTGESSDAYGFRLGNYSLTTFNNSGTITASTHGISNSGTITNLTNTGTITGTSGYGIWTDGSIPISLTLKATLPIKIISLPITLLLSTVSRTLAK